MVVFSLLCRVLSLLCPILSLLCHVLSSALKVGRKMNLTTRLCPACIHFISVPVSFELSTVLTRLLFCCLIASALFRMGFYPLVCSHFPFVWIIFNYFLKCMVSSRSHYHLSFGFSPFFKYMFRSLFLQSFVFHSSLY